MTAGAGSKGEGTVNAVWRLLVRLALIAAVVYACFRLRNIITTVFIAAIIAYVLDPVVEWLSRQRTFIAIHCAIADMSARLGLIYRVIFLRDKPRRESRIQLRRHALRVYASLYVFVLFFILLWQGALLITQPFVSEFRNASKPENRREIIEKINAQLQQYDSKAPEWARSEKIQEQLKKADFAKSAQQMAGEVGRRVFDSLKNIVEVVVLPVIAFYFLIDGRRLKHEFISLVPGSKLREAMLMSREFNKIMRAFVVGQVILCALAGVVVGLGLAALGVRYPLVLGVLAGVTRAIPIIGPIIGGIPIVLLTLATKGLGTALGVLGFFTFLHFAESKFVMPMLIGDRMELHPVVIIVVLIAGGEIGGLLIGGSIGSLLGMFFAAPLASIMRVMIRRYWLRLRDRHTPAARGHQRRQPTLLSAPAPVPPPGSARRSRLRAASPHRPKAGTVPNSFCKAKRI